MPTVVQKVSNTLKYRATLLQEPSSIYLNLWIRATHVINRSVNLRVPVFSKKSGKDFKVNWGVGFSLLSKTSVVRANADNAPVSSVRHIVLIGPGGENLGGLSHKALPLSTSLMGRGSLGRLVSQKPQWAHHH